ncbi:MAG: hypothetical protein FOGNACKC_06327 [Anaerolineae bacterium]|nr:hypothetical protein [Anaerolineae bacterium]
MARHYYLLMAFSDHDTAMAADRSFAQLKLPLADLGQLACVTNTWQTNDGIWLVSIHPTGVNLGVTDDLPRLTSTDQLDEIAKQLYRHLTEVEGCMCAMAGWEVAEPFMSEAHSSYRDLQFGPEVVAEMGWMDSLLKRQCGCVWTRRQCLSLSSEGMSGGLTGRSVSGVGNQSMAKRWLET